MTDDDPSSNIAAAAGIVGAGIGALVALPLGSVPGALLGAAVGGYGARMLSVGMAYVHRRDGEVIDAALAESGCSIEDFIAAMEMSEELQALAFRVAQAARSTSNRTKVRALGTCLGGASQATGAQTLTSR